jgi:hypothetical protein
MDSVIWANNALTTLASNITTSQTTIALTSGSGALFPNPGAGQFFPITIISATNSAVFEIVYCTARSGDSCTVIRAQEATTGKAFNAGDLAQNLITAGTLLPPGRLLNIQTFGTVGTSTYAETPGTVNCKVTVVGGGASGGGAQANSVGQVAYGGGGGGGGFAQGLFPVATLAGQTITVGAGGAPASGGGNNGGSSSIGAILSATGGVGGAPGFAAAPPAISAGGAGGGSSGGNLPGGLGGPGGAGLGIAVSNSQAGPGGASIISLGVVGPFSTTSVGNEGSGVGCGGSGAASQNGGSAQASGAGVGGVVIIEEYS